ncbi:MAG: signal peptidase II [Myxococcota bacterium]
MVDDKDDAAPSRDDAAAPMAAASPYRASYLFLIVVTLVNLVADLWSKHWAKTTFESIRPGGEARKVVIEGFMNFIFAKNRGGAWGLLQNETEALRRPFFLIVSVAAIVFIVSLYRKLEREQTALKWGLPLVLGGALGNLVDRVRYGYVVDFIDVYVRVTESMAQTLGWSVGTKHWPTFNIADVSICVGVGLMAIDMFTSRDVVAKEAGRGDPGGEAENEDDRPRDDIGPIPSAVASSAGAAAAATTPGPMATSSSTTGTEDDEGHVAPPR